MSKISEAEKFLQQPVFQQLAKELSRRYYLKGDFGQSVGLQLFKKVDTEPLRQFLGLTQWHWSTKKRVQVAEFSLALENSAVRWSIAEFVVFLTKTPLQLQVEVERKKEQAWLVFFEKIHQIDSIFTQQLTEKQLKNWMEELEGMATIFEVISKALQQLPEEFTYLPFFAYQQTGDAHAFDEGKLAGRLLLQMLAAQSKIPVDDQLTAAAEDKNMVLNEFYLLKDDIHNFVSIRGLLAEQQGKVRQMWEKACEEKVAWNVPLKEILRMDKVYPSGTKKVLIVENSSVYSVLLELLPEVAIVCSSGQFKYAVWQLLRKLVASDVTLYYSGDLDPEGLLMAQKLATMFPEKVQTVGMTMASYQSGKTLKALTASQLQQLKKIEIEPLREIANQMAVTHKKAYQEGFIAEILADVQQKMMAT